MMMMLYCSGIVAVVVMCQVILLNLTKILELFTDPVWGSVVSLSVSRRILKSLWESDLQYGVHCSLLIILSVKTGPACRR